MKIDPLLDLLPAVQARRKQNNDLPASAVDAARLLAVHWYQHLLRVSQGTNGDEQRTAMAYGAVMALNMLDLLAERDRGVITFLRAWPLVDDELPVEYLMDRIAMWASVAHYWTIGDAVTGRGTYVIADGLGRLLADTMKLAQRQNWPLIEDIENLLRAEG